MADQLDVVERVLQLLRDGRRSSTYKLAVLVALMDLCVEGTGPLGRPPSTLTTRQVAEKVIALYWPQVRPFGERDLQQNRGRRGRIPSAVLELRQRATGSGLGAGAGVGRVRATMPAAYQGTVDAVEQALIEMPLPKLQRVGGQDTGWLYRIGWDDGARLPSPARIRAYQAGRGGDFDNRLFLRPEVAVAFVRLHGLLRPFVEQEWTRQVGQMNGLEHERLHAFLFGADRAALRPVRGPLLELQLGRCFYCAEQVRGGQAEVDHFLPWSRHPDDGLDNLVVAHRRCNNDKRDHLAGIEHLERWVERTDTRSALLAQVAGELGWDRGGRSTGAACALYLRLPAEARLWSRVGRFEVVDPGRVRTALAR